MIYGGSGPVILSAAGAKDLLLSTKQIGGPDRSRPQLVEGPRKRDRLADVGDAADPRHRALHAKAEPRVHERAVFPEIQVPAVRVFRQLLRADAGEQLVVVVLALATADDFAVPLRSEHIVVEDGAGVGGVFLHIEGLHLLGVVEHHHLALVLLPEPRLRLTPSILT